ncbi:interphotoreceptor retinoid-binding protein [Geothrix limicola]|uniref:Interphotoreceptor retinoid-binding protein n=1 Tax=Geothrix limicola TaxID=2927978 RepID=A0ABQ5QET5_9BACT|nr:S41 family peptidase [Geothrix limicola]GLH73357.1 interphotoreceptor retinoid-binding protein [Geothrix limicola]
MRTSICFTLPALVLTLSAQEAPVPVTPDQQKAVVEALARELKARYVFPEVAEKTGTALKARLAKGAYLGATSAQAFAEALGKDLRDLGQDGHFRVRFDPAFQPMGDDDDRPPTREEVAQMRLASQRRAFGIAKVEQLQGNVGYLDVRGFGPTEFVGPALSSALQILSGTEALILDLRQNGGGEPESVAYLVSHFFEEGDSRHLNSIYNRPKNTTRQYWTSPTVAPRYTKPVYVLTSARTFSGGEECAYDFQTQKRATLVGETTGGGANPGGAVLLAHGFFAFIPTGRAINPVTNTNWEHVGVKPDVAAPAAEALKVAHVAILRAMLDTEKDPGARKRMEATLARVEKGEPEPPRYTR